MSVVINTIENQERYAEMNIESIESSAALRSWMQKHLLFYAGKAIPNEHLLIYVSYIRDRIDEASSVDGLMWKKAILELEKSLGGNSEF